MIGMRVEKPVKPFRLKIIDPVDRQRLRAGNEREKDPGICWMVAIVDAGEKPPDLVGIEQQPLVDSLIPPVAA
jgi:hypothetical protein